MYCSSHLPDLTAYRAEAYEVARTASRTAAQTSGTKYVNIRYVSLYYHDYQKVPVSRVRKAHDILQRAFSAQNTSELAKVPNTHPHPWKDRIGNPNIQFLPLDSSKVQVEYLKIDVASLDGPNPVTLAEQYGGHVQGVLNVWFGSSGNSILGQAGVGNSRVFCHYATIGDGEPELFAAYNMSKTLVHEVGHAFFLWHTFSDDQCNRQAVFSDVPEQIRPNYDTVLVQEGGQWVIKNDHRFNDRLNGTLESCLDEQADPSSEPNEMAINYMDYGVDAVSLMFTQDQVNIMRNWLDNNSSTGSSNSVKLYSSTDQSYSETIQSQEDESSANESGSGGSGSSSGGGGGGGGGSTGSGGSGYEGATGSTSSSSSDGLPTGAWVGIAVVAVFLLAGVGFLIYRKNRSHRESRGVLGATGPWTKLSVGVRAPPVTRTTPTA